MKDLLIQQGVHKALLGKEKKSRTMKDVEWVEMDEKVASAIHLNLGDEVIHNILEAKTAKEIWEKTRRSLYEKESDKQVVREEATLQFAYEGGFRFVGASQHI